MPTITRTRVGMSAVLVIGASALATAPATAAESATPSMEPVPAATEPADSAGTGACYTLVPGVPGSVEHPPEPTAIVLSMSQGGGFVPQAIAFIETPQFVLYGNDVALFRAAVPADADIADARPPFGCLQLTPDEVDELLTFALDEIGLADADAEYPNPNITDVGSTHFTIGAAGVDRTVSVHALGFDMAPEDQLEDRERFSVLAELLGDFGETVEGEIPYAVPAYPALLEEDRSDTPAEGIPWPWSDVLPESFVLRETSTDVVLTPEQVAMVTTVPNGGQAFIPVTSPDGIPLVLSVKPLLPAEG
jgi:hypothetical protein